MEKQKIHEHLVKIITEELELASESEITKESSLYELGIDSIALMSLIVYTEEELNYEAGEDALVDHRFELLGDLIDYIDEKIN